MKLKCPLNKTKGLKLHRVIYILDHLSIGHSSTFLPNEPIIRSIHLPIYWNICIMVIHLSTLSIHLPIYLSI